MEDVIIINGRQYNVHRNSVYLLLYWIVRQFGREFETPEKILFNTEMSSLRIIAEHNYRDLKELLTSKDYVQNLYVRQGHIGLIYRAYAIMLNFHAFLYKSRKTMEDLVLAPPSLDDYINSQ